jgi:predicted CoA-binding protein
MDDVQTMLEILQSAHTIAVVGLSDDPTRPSYEVAEYLQQHGYRIIPVNPTIARALGEPSYPDLAAVPEPIDVVLIFRRSDQTPPIVDQAIQRGAKAVWMQLGIEHPVAAERARSAGLKVIMNACMRTTHARFTQTGRL